MMIGDRMREIRQAQGRSLADVAGKAKVSVATLSRIENEKQSVELTLFLLLAKVLQVSPSELLGETGSDDPGVDPLVKRIAMLDARKRTDLWRELASERRSMREKRAGDRRNISQQVEELVAQLEFLREELESVRKRVRRR